MIGLDRDWYEKKMRTSSSLVKQISSALLDEATTEDIRADAIAAAG